MGSEDADLSLNLFSRGGAQCAGRILALVLAVASITDILRQAEFGAPEPKAQPGPAAAERDEPGEYAVRGQRAVVRAWIAGDVVARVRHSDPSAGLAR
jgi:hypothetical protein